MKIVCDSIIPPLPSTERGCGLHIGGTMKIEPRFLYCSNNLVIQRNLEETNKCRINSAHSMKAKVAKFSANGEWICSGDEAGNVAVWAHRSFVIKNTIVVGKCCLDIAWSADGQRIVAVGKGKDDKGKVFPWNTNNKLGELGGAQKGFLCCDFKPNRPFRVVTGAEDYGVYYYKGPPFKFETYDKTHKNYVNAVKFTPDGVSYLSVSSDKKVLVFDAKTGKLTRTICDGKGKNNTHKGSIYEIVFSSDGKYFLTASADKTCKVWDYEKGEVIHTYTFADKPSVNDMQVTCAWIDKYLISISLSGRINYLDPEFKQERPIKILTGHRKNITDLDVDYVNNTVYSIDHDSRVVRTECKSQEMSDMFGDPHKGTPLKYIRVTCDGKAFYTVANNDTLCLSSTDGNKMGDKVIKLDGAAKGLLAGKCNNDLCIVPTHKNKIIFIKNLEIQKELNVSYTPSCCAISSNDKYLAVGGDRNDKNIHVYNIDDFKEEFTINAPNYLQEEIIHLSFSPNGDFLASADKYKKIWVWDLKNSKYDEPLNKTKGMKFHGGLISSLEWSPDGQWLLSTAYDSTIYLFTNPTEGGNKNIHLEPKENVTTFIGAVKRMKFLSQNKLVGIGGDDLTMRFFDIIKE